MSFCMQSIEGSLMQPLKEIKLSKNVHDHLKFLFVVCRTHSTFKDTCCPSGLHLRDGHDGSQWLNQTNDSQCRTVQLRGEHIFVERRFVLRHWDHVSAQEWKRELVACGEHLRD